MLAVFGIHRSANAHYDVALEVEIIPENGQGLTVCRSNFKHMYWNMRQQLGASHGQWLQHQRRRHDGFGHHQRT